MLKRCIALILSALLFTGCSLLPTSGTQTFVYDETEEAAAMSVDETEFLKDFTSKGFEFVRYEHNEAAEYFQISQFKKYGKTVKLLVINGNENYLICPADFSTDEVEKAFGDELTVLTQGVREIYLAATAAGAHFRAIGAIGSIGYSSIRAGDWYVDEIAEAMNDGQIEFAGKYSAPDYELLSAAQVPLAVESTMILHSPAVKEKLQKLKIPVLTDYSSYESSAIARMEWVKVYGLLTGREQQAADFFEEKSAQIQAVSEQEPTGRTCAFFSLDASGNAIVRTGKDYIAGMIAQAGGEYAFSKLSAPNAGSHSGSLSITFEEFYSVAKDVDVLIINTAIEGSYSTLSALIKQNRLFCDFAAVQSGEVYETSAGLYQSLDKSAEIIEDMHRIFSGEEPEEFFTRLE